MYKYLPFGNHGCYDLQAKEERKHLACCWHIVQKSASMMVLGCISAQGIMGNLYIRDITINADGTYGTR